MLDDGIDEQMVRMVEERIDKRLTRIRALDLSPEVLAASEVEIRAAVVAAARARRRTMRAGREH
jgi:hypothetical protein